MRLTPAVQGGKKQNARNTSNGLSVLVHPATFWDSIVQPRNGFTLDKQNLTSVSPDVCTGTTLIELEKAIEKARQDSRSPIYGLDMDAWEPL